MLIPVILFILGLVIICIGGDKFVDNAVIVAKKLGMSEIMVGATIVSIGTTLPEVLVSTTAAFNGSAAICAGNAYGSIICNTALIAGISQLCRPSKGVDKKSFNWNVGLFFLFSIFLFAVQYFTGTISRLTGLVLLAGFVIYTLGYIKLAGAGSAEAQEQEEEEASLPTALLMLVFFAIALFRRKTAGRQRHPHCRRAWRTGACDRRHLHRTGHLAAGACHHHHLPAQGLCQPGAWKCARRKPFKPAARDRYSVRDLQLPG